MAGSSGQKDASDNSKSSSSIGTFEFVDELDYRNPENHKRILSTIRSRAKTDYHAKKRQASVRFDSRRRPARLAPAEGDSPSSSLQISTPQHSQNVSPKSEYVELSNAFGGDGFIKGEIPSRVSPLVSGTWQQDPFQVYNLPKDPRVEFLIAEFNQRFRQTYSTLDGHLAVFTINFLHPVLHHVMLYHTGAFLLWQNSTLVDESFVTYHRIMSMRLVHDALDDPVERSSDHIISALLFLCFYEELHGTPENAKIHRNGLDQVLKIRKETGQPLSWFLKMILPLQDSRAIMEGKPELQVTDDLNDGTITLVPAELEITQTSMQEVFNRLKKDSSIMFALPPSSNSQGRRRVGFETGIKIARRLKILDIEIDTKDLEITRNTHKPWLLASLIYLHTIQATPDELFRLPEEDRKLVHELKSVLEKVIEIPRNWYLTCVLLWVLFFGGLHSTGKEFMWFRKQIRNVCIEMKLETWAEMRQELRDLPWVESGVEWKLKALCGLCQ